MNKSIKEKLDNFMSESKIKDKEGNPIVLYHGTSEDFESFEKGKENNGTGHATSSFGFFFSNDYNVASSFADTSQSKKSPNVIPVYINMKNPKVYKVDNDYKILMETKRKLELEMKPFWGKINEEIEEENLNINEFINKFGMSKGMENFIIEEDKIKDKITNGVYSKLKNIDREILNLPEDKKENPFLKLMQESYTTMGLVYKYKDTKSKEYLKNLKKEGYDGIVILGTETDSVEDFKLINQFIVFEPNQIKSIYDKEFNPKNNLLNETKTQIKKTKKQLKNKISSKIL